MNKQRKEFQRQETKTSDGELLYELQHAYELSPKLSEQILLTAKECLVREYALKEGQIEATVVGIEERAGKVLEKMEKKKVRLTIDGGIEDREALKEYGRCGLRQIRIQRISEEAIEQGGVVSQEDLARYLSCTVRTIQRDMQEILQRGIEVTTRGYLHNMGKGQTHKLKILGMYLDGKTYSEIKLRIRHSAGAIKRYVETFTKVLMSRHWGIRGEKEIGVVTGLSEQLVKQYVKLIDDGKKDAVRKETMNDLIERAGYREGLKKTIKNCLNPQVAMIGGNS